jgi:RimJ/RimL family protein N-acetyltransferase
MEYFPAPLTRAQSDQLIARIEGSFRKHGFGLWALELPGETSCAGFVGLLSAAPSLPFAPAVELGWRMARAQWGRGIATEAATAAMTFAFEELEIAELVSFTTVGNLRSRRVMERLGMRRDQAEDFMHPELAPEDPLALHVLYRIPAPVGPVR